MIFSNPLLFFPLFLTLFPFTLGVTLPLVAPRVLTLLDSDKKLASDIIQFARTGYVDPVTIKLWKCGEPCDRVAPVYYEASGGNGNSAPNWFVLYWPAQNAIVINHQGTSPDKLGTVLIDLKISPRPLQIPPFNDISRGSPPDARVHTGFFGDYLTSANQIRVQVKSILKDGVTTPSGTKEMPDKIFVTGYSLGAAVAVLNALDLALSLPESIPVTAITIGTPKIGNKAFADWADKVLDPKRNIRIVNEKDIVPLLPPDHVVGSWYQVGTEWHVADTGNTWLNCGMASNYGDDPRCSGGHSILTGNPMDHYYAGKDLMTWEYALTPASLFHREK